MEIIKYVSCLLASLAIAGTFHGLSDRAKEQVEHAIREERDRQLVSELGEFIRNLLEWSWYVTITFRFYPGRTRTLPEVIHYLNDLEHAACNPIGWIVADGFGEKGERYHCHLLVAGVDHVDIDEWWRRSFARFGRSEIKRYDPSKGAAYYVAKHALAETGSLSVGGKLLDSPCAVTPGLPVGRVVVARSAEVPSALYHMTLGRRRKR